jgi:hypothetical protein
VDPNECPPHLPEERGKAFSLLKHQLHPNTWRSHLVVTRAIGDRSPQFFHGTEEFLVRLRFELLDPSF